MSFCSLPPSMADDVEVVDVREVVHEVHHVVHSPTMLGLRTAREPAVTCVRRCVGEIDAEQMLVLALDAGLEVERAAVAGPAQVGRNQIEPSAARRVAAPPPAGREPDLRLRFLGGGRHERDRLSVGRPARRVVGPSAVGDLRQRRRRRRRSSRRRVAAVVELLAPCDPRRTRCARRPATTAGRCRSSRRRSVICCASPVATSTIQRCERLSSNQPVSLNLYDRCE